MYTLIYSVNSCLLSRICVRSSKVRFSRLNGPHKFLTSSRNLSTENSFLRNCHVNFKITNRKQLLERSVSRINSIGHRFFATKSPDDEPVQPPHQDEQNFNSQLPATVAVPEVWPHVPVIAINRNIVFPRFLKLIEVSNYLNINTAYVMLFYVIN